MARQNYKKIQTAEEYIQAQAQKELDYREQQDPEGKNNEDLVREKFLRLKKKDPRNPIRESEFIIQQQKENMKKGGSVMSRGNKLARSKPTKIC